MAAWGSYSGRVAPLFETVSEAAATASFFLGEERVGLEKSGAAAEIS